MRQWARRRGGGSFSFISSFCLGLKNKTLFVWSIRAPLSCCPLVLPEGWKMAEGSAQRDDTPPHPVQTHASKPGKWISIRGAVAHSGRLLDTAWGHRCRDFPPPRNNDDKNKRATKAKSFWFWKSKRRPSGRALPQVKQWYCGWVATLTFVRLLFLLCELKNAFVPLVFKICSK